MGKEIVHRDEIHGDVNYDPLAVALLDAAPLQRLGRVYQLGYGHLVYRGGTHTRLSHSMGAYHTAARLVDALRNNYERKRKPPKGAIPPKDFLPTRPITAPRDLTFDLDNGPERSEPDRWIVLQHLVCWAALLHDVGHIPLGHTLEDEFEGIYQRHDDLSSPRLRHLWFGAHDGADPEIGTVFQQVHLYPDAFHRLGLTNAEDIWATVLLICTFKEKIDLADRETFQDFLEKEAQSSDSAAADTGQRLLDLLTRLSPSLFAPYMADIVANTISADYLDYLRRDPHNLGLDVLKDDRVVSQFWIGLDERDQPRMALSLVNGRGKPRLDTCTGVVELVRQRYRFAEIVYYHKTKVAASAMLAKVFHLIGVPAETPITRDVPSLQSASKEVSRLLSLNGPNLSIELESLKSHCLPSSLLDPELGDESLPLFLAEQAWTCFADAIAANQRRDAVKALQAIALIDGIVRRRLYKVALMMTADDYRQLSSRRDTPGPVLERSLTQFIQALRGAGGATAREKTEAAMVDAAGWPNNSLLLYVPPRKSQAKGIETGALADGRVITLGIHPAVVAQVDDLNERYRALWRLIVLVHPDHASNAVELSAAIDAFMHDRFPETNLDDGYVLSTLNNACWFDYIPQSDREATIIYKRLLEGIAEEDIDWLLPRLFGTTLGSRTSAEELATGAALVAALGEPYDRNGTVERVVKRYPKPGDLTRRVTDLMESTAVESSEGSADAPAEILSLRKAIRGLAMELKA